MSMIFKLFESFEKIGMKMEMPSFHSHFMKPSKLKQVILDRVLKKELSMIEFKSELRKVYIEKVEVLAEEYVDECLKFIFDHTGDNMSKEDLSPYRNLLIMSSEKTQLLAYDEMMESFFSEIEFFTESSLNHFMSVKRPMLLMDAYMKYFIFSKKSSVDESLAMDMFCYNILNATVEKHLIKEQK